ncbi:maleylpyruvate isomerase family mycothiol-dependent enzyme [Actinoplanes sp. NPDC023801]|uniref:maleylpyruvate isomerase family mycothiol-dependent enzyme n=1 Tax=Actinoplanes sp. NPDC023801 TaxID=3154595 RepID=UPI003402F2B0
MNLPARALRSEADAFAAALHDLSPADWRRPTRCAPWQVRDLVGHVILVVSRTTDMIADAAPVTADTTATGYYRADERFNPTANTDRVRSAQSRAGTGDGRQLAVEFATTVGAALAAAAAEPAGRLVRTRHGDAMLLTDFLTTRVVEVAVHGLDVADAVARPAWLTAPAAELLQQLLFGLRRESAMSALGWDPVTLLRRVTGRAPVTAADIGRLTELGLRPLTLS